MNHGYPGEVADLDIVAYSFDLGQQLLTRRTGAARKRLGQYLTPPVVARYMAQQLQPRQAITRVLDPAMGSGILLCAVIEQVIESGYPTELVVEGYEVDKELCLVARQVLAVAREKAAYYGITLHSCVYEADFVLAHASLAQPGLLLFDPDMGKQSNTTYDAIIANPPYFKLHSKDPRARAVVGKIKGHTNIYTLFMGLGTRLLSRGGLACFVVPRSFCSGAYFASFRREFLERATPLAIHVLTSRQANFKQDEILQENVIVTFKGRESHTAEPDTITITVSQDTAQLHGMLLSRQISTKHFLGRRNGGLFFRLPTTELDDRIIETIDNWPGTLAHYGISVSTGPVVAFRAEAWLREAEAVGKGEAAPLLWMQNVSAQKVNWPVTRGKKAQAIACAHEVQMLLIRVANYVLIRRFSAKEERRRLTAAPFLRQDFAYGQIGLENHLNYLYRAGGELEIYEAVGLAALLNSALVDRYFRITNGNTQVNAAELRALPLPPLPVIKKIGENVTAAPARYDTIVFNVLRAEGCLAVNFPTISETRLDMGKIQEAQDVLKTLGLPRAQQNEMAALILLVLAQLSEETPWAHAQKKSLRVHDMLGEIQAHYGRQYAENTRETIRRQVIHQFLQAGVALHNPDTPTLPTNSPRTHYALADPVLDTIRAYGSAGWTNAAQAFLEKQRSLIETYHHQREHYKVPLVMEGGTEYHLSPGAHNELQVLIIEEFGPRFAPGAKVLYVGDTTNKMLHLDMDGFRKLGIPISSHDKLPDVVLHDANRNWLYLIEAVISHGPMSPKRKVELQALLGKGTAELIYVTAFHDFNAFKNFLLDIAWGTDVWIADRPSHLIHFNGERPFGPRDR